MNLLHRSAYLRRSRHHHHHQIRTLYDGLSTMRCPRDRGLDHAVEREKHLKPLLNLRNLIISEPSKSIPLSLITKSTETLGIPFRPIEFIRKYPSIFQEFHPGQLNIQPHIKLTPEIVSLSSEENLVYETVDYKQEMARRLLKLLMINRINKVPIFLLEQLKWELGLPPDFENVLVPEFPDYFRVISENGLGENGKALELVCWSDEFAVSAMEKKRAKDGKIQFALEYSKEFEMDKKYKKWVDDWQKLPYVSPYENAMHLAVNTDESDKWVVAVLHELLNLFVGKKAERETLLSLGEFFGLRSRFKRAFLQHPGIFYVSSKIGTHTVVLKEAYKRGMLIERHPVMDMRFKYVKLMNVVKDEEKPKSSKPKTGDGVKRSEGKESGGEDGEDDDDEEDDEDKDEDEDEDVDSDEMCDSSDEDESDDNKEAFEGKNMTKRGRFGRKDADFGENNTRRNVGRRTNGRTEGNDYGNSTRFSRRTDNRSGENTSRRTNGRNTEENEYGNSKRFSRGTNDRGGENVARRTNERRTEGNEYENSARFSRRTNGRSNEGNEYENSNRSSKRTNNWGGENVARRTNGRSTGRNEYENSTRFSRRTDNLSSEDGARKTYGRRTEGYENSSRFSRRTNSQGGENVTRRTNGRSSEGYENSSRFSRRTNSEGGENVTRRTNGRSSEGYENSSRVSRRTNVRGGDTDFRRSPTKNSGFSGNKARSKTDTSPV